MSFQVQGKVALVTGANRGIGKAIVESLLKHGAKKVYAAVRKPEAIAEWAQESGGKIVPLEVELSAPATVQAAAKAAQDVDLVINNAGVYRSSDLLSSEAEDALRYELEVNLFGLLHVAQAFAPVLAKNGGGAFVQLNSVVSIKSFLSAATYSASKAASYSLTQALKEAFATQGTQVVSVHPGPIKTDMANQAGFGEIAESPDLVADGILHALEHDEFHVFPDSMARQLWSAYQGYAAAMVESTAVQEA